MKQAEPDGKIRQKGYQDENSEICSRAYAAGEIQFR